LVGKCDSRPAAGKSREATRIPGLGSLTHHIDCLGKENTRIPSAAQQLIRLPVSSMHVPRILGSERLVPTSNSATILLGSATPRSSTIFSEGDLIGHVMTNATCSSILMMNC
jgi:hypothetical protein